MNSQNSQQDSQHQSQESQQGIGPFLLQQSSQQYHKRLSSFFSISSDSQDATHRFPESQHPPNINFKLIKQRQSVRRFQTKQLQSPEFQQRQTTVKNSQDNPNLSTSNQLVKNQLAKLMYKLIRHRYIQQFAQNLLLNSYVLSNVNKQFLLEEDYLQEKKSLNQNEVWGKKSSYILQPSSSIIFFFDTYLILIQIISLWLAPFLSSFQNLDQSCETLKLIILSSYLLEIFVSVNRAIVIQGDIILERKKIIKIYLQTQFSYDLMLVLAWMLYALKFEEMTIINEAIGLISSLINIKKIAQNYYNQVEHFYLKSGVNNFLDLITLIILIFFYAHIMACLWYYIGRQGMYSETWLIKYQLVEAPIWAKYSLSFYWSTVTIATIGYGDITPQNQLEVVFCSFMILFSSCVYAYLMNSIGIILKHINDNKFKYLMQISLISQYMNRNQVNQHIQVRVKNFLKFNIENQQKENQEADLLIAQLPEPLKFEMTSEIKNIQINKILLLKQNFSKDLLSKLSKKVEYFKYVSGDVIFKQHDQQNHKLYFIINGQVDLLEQRSKRVFQKVNSAQCFNEYSFFSGFPPKLTAVCKEYSEILQIDRESMQDALFGFSKDREKFHMIKDQINFSNSFKELQIKCNFCQKMNHQAIDCQIIQYKPDLEQRMKKMFYKSNQDRQQFKRKTEKYHSLIAQSIVQESVQKYCLYKADSELEDPFSSLNSKNSATNKLPLFESEKITQRISKNLLQQQYQEMNKYQQQQSFNTNDQKQHIHPIFNFEPGKFLDIQIPNYQQLAQIKEESLPDILQQPLQFHSTIIDQLKNYKFYYPKQNANSIIKQYNNANLSTYHEIINTQLLKRQYHVYTFNFNLIEKMYKYKNIK